MIACTSNCKVYNDNLDLLQTLTVSGRVYAPQCVADLDGNGKMDLCAYGTRGCVSCVLCVCVCVCVPVCVCMCV